MPLVYTLTELGQETLSTDASKGNLPQDYRRLLGLIEVGGHVEVLKGRLRKFSDQIIEDWLKELAELKLVESHEAGELDEITFTGARLPPQAPLTDEDRKQLAKTTV